MAWTIVETVEVWKGSGPNEEMIEVKLACTSDATGTDYDIVTDLIKGACLYMVKIVPGTSGDAPGAAFNLDVEDETDAHILDTDSNSTSATTFHAGANTIGAFPVIKGKCSVVIATLATGKKADVYLQFVR